MWASIWVYCNVNESQTYEQKYLNILIAETECADVLFS